MRVIELYSDFIVIRVLPLRISDKMRADDLGIFSTEFML